MNAALPVRGAFSAGSGRARSWPVPAVAWGLWLVGAALLVVAGLTTRAGSPVNDPASTFLTVLTALAFVTVGAIMITRLPRQLIGWLLWIGGLSAEISLAAGGLADRGLLAHPGSVPGAVWFAVINQWTAGMIFEASIMVGLLFPTGTVPSRRWRPLALGILAFLGLFTLGSLVGPWTGGMPGHNPLEPGGAWGATIEAMTVVINVGFVVSLALSALSIVVRYRMASGLERAQIRWLAAALTVVVGTFIVAVVIDGIENSNGSTPGTLAYYAWLPVDVSGTLLPVAIGIAVLRYRLYEIDRLISRTVAYALVGFTLAAVFAGAVLVLGAVLAPVTRSNELAVAGSTLLIAALFQPLRTRLQRIVDRRFNRARYDAERTVTAFAARLRDEIDTERLRSDLLATVEGSLEPTTVSLWLR